MSYIKTENYYLKIFVKILVSEKLYKNTNGTALKTFRLPKSVDLVTSTEVVKTSSLLKGWSRRCNFQDSATKPCDISRFYHIKRTTSFIRNSKTCCGNGSLQKIYVLVKILWQKESTKLLLHLPVSNTMQWHFDYCWKTIKSPKQLKSSVWYDLLCDSRHKNAQNILI